MRVEGALTIKAPRPGAHKYTLLWSLSFWWCFRCVCTVIMSKILQNKPRVTVKGQHGANFGHARAKDPEISVCCLCVRHLRQGLTPWPVNLMATKHTHSHSCTQKNEQPGKQAGECSQTRTHVRTQTHRGQPVLSCQSEPRPSIKMTVGQTGTRTGV